MASTNSYGTPYGVVAACGSAEHQIEDLYEALASHGR